MSCDVLLVKSLPFIKTCIELIILSQNEVYNENWTIYSYNNKT